ncbi:MAG: NAD(P)/FAD-dependent oxidoreductase [Flavobacteriia bacterium]|nr:NAD(P)/FAD-dependent oxidoreductase [Flavobacteriia bacterium]
MLDIAIVGGGAAGYFAAIQAALLHPSLRIAILERGNLGLDKVRVSGGGRCNVTHHALDPKHLTTHYPRGEKALLGPFHHYGPSEVIDFFEQQGVPLKIESDGRMFPVANSSQAIIDCFVSLRESLGISLYTKCALKSMSQNPDGSWLLGTADQQISAKKILLATGSNPKIFSLLSTLGHEIVAPVPSLFTFNISDPRLEGLAGLSTPASVKLLLPGQAAKKALSSSGPLLITHWGLSGPAVLKLSAWGARLLATEAYDFRIEVNFLPQYSPSMLIEQLYVHKKKHAKKRIYSSYDFELPKRLWQRLVSICEIEEHLEWAHITKTQLAALATELGEAPYAVSGKSTFKEEFVTAGGIKLGDVSFKDCQSKLFSGLYFAGEILNIDAITGGFNFQSAWTTGFLAAQGMVDALQKASLENG